MAEEIREKLKSDMQNEIISGKVKDITNLIMDVYQIGLESGYNIANKYNTQPDYKSAWEELKKTILGEDEEGNNVYFETDGEMAKIEQKYHLGE